MTLPFKLPFIAGGNFPALPYALPYTFTIYTPPRDRTCHVLNTVRSVTVLPNNRTFIVPDDE